MATNAKPPKAARPKKSPAGKKVAGKLSVIEIENLFDQHAKGGITSRKLRETIKKGGYLMEGMNRKSGPSVFDAKTGRQVFQGNGR